MTIASALRSGTQKLSGSSDAPHLDAERLLLHVIGRSESAWLYAHKDVTLSSSTEKQFAALLERRHTGEPLAYLLGEWEFLGRPFWVTPDVLIPRPETENLVEAALRYIETLHQQQIIIADIGTGSGCIAVTLACELAKVKCIATDISPTALAVARKNAERHGVADRIEFVEGDMLQPFDFAQGKPLIDLIVSNPPYIPTQELTKAKDARDTIGLTFEPTGALDGGQDGQKFIEQIKNAGVPALVESTNGVIISLLP